MLPSICDMCRNKCGLIATVEKGGVKKLDPHHQFLKSRGMLCAKGNAGIKQLYDPDRLKYPLLRKGARGQGRWQRLSWPQALHLAAEKLKVIGKNIPAAGSCSWPDRMSSPPLSTALPVSLVLITSFPMNHY